MGEAPYLVLRLAEGHSMVYAKPQSRIPWEDQFRMPSLDALRSHYNHQLEKLVETAREKLLAHDCVREDIQWMGLPWRWTLVYRYPGDSTHAWAYLIPHRDSPILATPLTTKMIESFPMSRLKKYIREGLDHGQSVADMHWVAWKVTNKTHLELVLDLLNRKRKFIAKRA